MADKPKQSQARAFIESQSQRVTQDIVPTPPLAIYRAIPFMTVGNAWVQFLEAPDDADIIVQSLCLHSLIRASGAVTGRLAETMDATAPTIPMFERNIGPGATITLLSQKKGYLLLAGRRLWAQSSSNSFNLFGMAEEVRGRRG